MLRAQLTPGNGVGAVFLLDLQEAVGHQVQGLVPGGLGKGAVGLL